MGSPTPQAHGQDTSDSQGGIVYYRVKWTNTAATSPTFPLSMSEGITSVAYSATGILTITLANNFYQFADMTGGITQSTYNASTGACKFTVTSATGTTGVVVIVLRNEAGTAVAGATGDVMYFTISVQNYKSQ
jgi:hypothetical protein